MPSRRFLFGWALAFSPAIVYSGLLVHYATNIPRGDDYLSILPFLCDWLDGSTFAQKFSLISEQYFSHRIAVTKLVVLAQYQLSGQCNFLFLQAVGWVGWLALTACLALSTPAVRIAPWLGLPLFLLLMQPQGYSNLHTAMQAVGNIGVLGFAWAALAAATARSLLGFTVSLGCALLASSSAVNGLLVFPVATLGLVLHGDRRRALVFALVGAAAWLAYFSDFATTPVRFVPLEFLGNAAAMTGGLMNLVRAPLALSIAAGSVILLIGGALLLSPRSWRALPTHAAFLLFLILSIAMAAYGRLGWGSDYMLQDRYRIYGLLCVAVLLLFATTLTRSLERPSGFAAACAGAGVFCFLSYLTFLPEMVGVARWCEATAMNRQLGHDFFVISPEPWAVAAANLHRAEQRGVYQTPRYFSSAELEAVQSAAQPVALFRPAFRAEPNGAVRGFLLTPNPAQAAPPAPDFAVLAQNSRRLVLPRQVTRARLADVLARRSVFSANYAFILPEAVAQPGPAELHAWSRPPGGSLAQIWSAAVQSISSTREE